MTTKNKKILSDYYKPTPVKWRKIGDSILYGCGVIGATGLIGFDELKDVFSPKELKILIGAVLILGFVGKFITNFFKEETNED
jgi:hypothetical protein